MPPKSKTTPAASTSPPSSPTATAAAAHKRSPSAAAASTPNSTTSTPRPRSRGASQGAASSPRPVALAIAPPDEPSIPSPVGFVLATIISLSFASALNTFAVQFTGPELASVSRSLHETWEVYLVVAWKVLELGIGWISGLDSADMACLTFLTHLPHFYLLHTYYDVPRLPLVVYMQINVFANSLPFYLLRRSNTQHAAAAFTATDVSTRAATMLLSSALYALPLFTSLATWLPTSLAVHFEGLHTLAPAHAASFPGLLTLPPVLAMGYFSYRFVFVPVVCSPLAATALVTTDETTVLRFDPATATFVETLHYNVFWPLYRPPRQQLFLLRTFVLAAWTAANTLFLTNGTVDGCDLQGAARWAALWGVSAALSSVTMGWVAGAL